MFFLNQLTNLQHKGNSIDKQAKICEMVNNEFPLSSRENVLQGRKLMNEYQKRIIDRSRSAERK